MTAFQQTSIDRAGALEAPAFPESWATSVQPAVTTVEAAAFREALGCFASGVTVVTAAGEGRVAGLTANAFTAVSLDPPLVLVCIQRGSRSLEALRRAGQFAVHVLRADQVAEARAFARAGDDKLAGIAFDWSADGLPRLGRYLVRLDCALEAEYPGGDHAIVLGRVRALALDGETREPMTYFRGRLGALAPAGT